MDITPIMSESAKRIERYGDGAFVVSGEEFKGNIFITPEHVELWTAPVAEDLSDASISQLVEAAKDVDILLYGAGAQMPFVTPTVRAKFKDHDMVLDVIDTGAACRTFNILMNEERRVAALLLAV